MVRLTVATPPRDAAAVRTDLTGLVVHPDTLRAQTTAIGEALADGDDAAVARVQATREATESVDLVPALVHDRADAAADAPRSSMLSSWPIENVQEVCRFCYLT